MSRVCSKPTCRRAASAACGLSPADRIVWLVDLPKEKMPAYFDLCEEHATSLRVMHGWQLEDLRDTEGQQHLIAL